MATVEWIDLNHHGFEVVAASFTDDPHNKVVAVRGDRSLDSDRQQALVDAGFLPVQGPRFVWARKGNAFRYSDLTKAFPHARIVDMPQSRTSILVRGVSPFTGAVVCRPEGAEGLELVNSYQARYKSFSRVGEPTGTIPVNLARATAVALRTVEQQHGPVDAFVAHQLQWSQDELGECLSPEQVDAVALAMFSALNGNAFIIADMTGFGKGRTIAALLRWAVLRGRTAVFLTEKANLFTDIWRDIVDIGSGDVFGAPFLLNKDSSILDQKTKEVLFQAPPEREIKKILKAGEPPAGSRLVIATYSQFNRKNTAKSKFLAKVCEGNHLFLDESHNAAGDSNTGLNVGAAMRVADAYTFSSATFARGADNMAAYAPVFPATVSSNDLSDVLRVGGPPLLEALSQSLAESGVLIRREHDLSNIRLDVSPDQKRAQQHREMADSLSPILSMLAKLAMKVDDLVEEKNIAEGEGKGKPRWYTVNFGSRLGNIVAQFLTALKVDSCVEECVAALKAGEKPVVVINNTMEAMMRELADDGTGAGVKAALEQDLFGSDDGQAEENQKAPELADALKIMLQRILTINVKRPGEDPERVAVDDETLLQHARAVAARIEDFPRLPLSPIDDIRERVERLSEEMAARGEIDRPWVMDEISARSMRVRNGRYIRHNPRDRNEIIADFQNGEIDGLVLTGAASTGLSLHAAAGTPDKRIRIMLELQIPANVLQRVQFWGRINRRGQVVDPKFKCLTTTLTFENRILQVQNKKVAELSANVTGNAETSNALDVPDLINLVGNDVAQRLLQERPKLAARMGISLRIDPEAAAEELYYINRALSRMPLISSQEADALYEDILAGYADVIRELDAKGGHPGKPRELEGAWSIDGYEMFDPGNLEDTSPFGRPVYVATVSRQRVAHPISGQEVEKRVATIRKRLGLAEWEKDVATLYSEHRAVLIEQREAILTRSLPSRYKTVAEALRAGDDNGVKIVNRKIKDLLTVFKDLEPGVLLSVTNDDAETSRAVVTDIRLPDVSEAHLPSAYGVRYIIPGDEKDREISLAGLMRDPKLMIFDLPKGKPGSRYREYEQAAAGVVNEVRKVLCGNLFSAVKTSKQHGFGTAVTFTDTGGTTRKGVLIPKSKQDRLNNLPFSTRSAAVAAEVIKNGGGPLFTNAEVREDSLLMWGDQRGVVVEVPGKKTKAKPYETDDMKALVGQFKGDWRGREAVVPPSKLEAVLKLLIRDGHTFHFDGRWRHLAIKAAPHQSSGKNSEEIEGPSYAKN